MFRVLLLLCAARTVFGIIVKDHVPPGEEYNYSYEIENPATGDSKSLYEARLGGTVKGRYSVLDPDGTRRTVHYTADPHIGFRAVLVQEPVPDTYFTAREYFAYEDEFRSVHAPRTQYMDPYLPLQLRYSKVYQPDRYFTPANELSSEKKPINGLYFEPNKSD